MSQANESGPAAVSSSGGGVSPATRPTHPATSDNTLTLGE